MGPAFAVVRGLINPAPKGASIQSAVAGRARRIEQNVRYRVRWNAGIDDRLSVNAAIGCDGDSTGKFFRVIVPPHLRMRKIVGAAESAPDQPAPSRIECQPVSCVAPVFRHAC